MGCDSSQNFDDENRNNFTKGDAINQDSDEDNRVGNKENKDNRRNKKDQRKRRDKKNQIELRVSEDDDYFSNSDSYKINKKAKKKLKSSKKKKDDSDKSEEEDNKEENSNQNTEGMATVETRKLNFKRQENGCLIIMDGIEDLIPEDLTEDDIYQLVEDTLGDNIVENESEKIQGTITRKQARSVASVLYKKLQKKKGKYNIDINEYPELKGLNIRIGAGQLTKDVIKNMMFNDDNINDKDLDKAYNKITKNTNDLKALTIVLLDDNQ